MIKLNGKAIELKHFPDGTFLIKEKPSCDQAFLSWKFEHNDELVALIYITQHLRAHGVRYVELYMPYIPNARQDRVKYDEDVFTLKYFAWVINSLGFDKVRVIDPHSSVAEALIDRIEVLTPAMFVDTTIRSIYQGYEVDGPILAFYPDEGAMKRYSGMVKMPYAFGIKDRDWSSGQINGLSVCDCGQSIKGKTVLIIDDISSRGGTFYHSAKKLKELGADKVFLYVTHCENTILDGEVLTSGLIEKVFTTSSLLTKKHEKIEVIEI